MTDSEFTTWFEYHVAAFPEIDSWLGKLDNAGAATIDHWRAVLSRQSPVDCRAATDAMVADSETERTHFSSHSLVL